MASANICCPIELEPKTLSEGQLNHARVAAADVAQKMKSNEAAIVFTTGLEPVGEETNEQKLQAEEPVDKLEQCSIASEQKAQVIERPCQCAVTSAHVESPDNVYLKEPLSAPF